MGPPPSLCGPRVPGPASAGVSASCSPPRRGSTALQVRAQTPERGDSTGTGQPSPSPGTWQLVGAEPPDASLRDALGVPLAWQRQPRSYPGARPWPPRPHLPCGDPCSLLSAGSPKRSPTGRSRRRRRRRCTWSRSTRSPGSPTASSRSWWCCPARSTSTSGWPATVRGAGRGAGHLHAVQFLGIPRAPLVEGVLPCGPGLGWPHRAHARVSWKRRGGRPALCGGLGVGPARRGGRGAGTSGKP